jgi:hypothetical protein
MLVVLLLNNGSFVSEMVILDVDTGGSIVSSCCFCSSSADVKRIGDFAKCLKYERKIRENPRIKLGKCQK